jgi:hypothetical protein
MGDVTNGQILSAVQLCFQQGKTLLAAQSTLLAAQSSLAAAQNALASQIAALQQQVAALQAALPTLAQQANVVALEAAIEQTASASDIEFVLGKLEDLRLFVLQIKNGQAMKPAA